MRFQPADAVEGVEEGVQRHDPAPLVPGRLAEPELVEGPDRQAVEQPGRHPRRGRQPLARGRRPAPARGGVRPAGRSSSGGVVAPGQHRPAEGPAPGQAVDPGHRVAVAVVARLHAGQGVVEVGGPFGVDPDARRLDRGEPQRGRGHDPGQAHPAGGGPEQVPAFGVVGVALGVEVEPSGRGGQRQRRDVLGEAPVPMVVLAVDVGGDGAARR